MGARGDSAAPVGADSGRKVDGATDPGSSVRGACSNPELRITEIDVGAKIVANEDEAALKPLAISALPSGGSRVAWMGDDAHVHITTLDVDDMVQAGTSTVSIAANDYADLYADDRGGVALVTRPSQGGGTLNCGTPANLCGTPPNPPLPCYDMYLVRFDGGAETWATQLTQSSATHPPYLNDKTDRDNVIFIWWYAHHGRIAFDGDNFAAYYGAAISVSQSGCVNIHQGDEMRVVGPDGALKPGGFDWGCSHSGYERVVWDGTAGKFVTICKNDAPTGGKSGRLAFAPATATIYPLDLNYSNVGNIVLAQGGGYWTVSSDIRGGQPAGKDGLADVHLLHFTSGAPDKDIILASDADLNDRAPHLASYGSKYLLAAWETSPAKGDLLPNDAKRKFYVQVLDAATGAAVSAPIEAAIHGNRYHELKPFPDGSVAYTAPGSADTKLKVLRTLPCE